jgi:AbrB family looped-hinge helix DNA binding protein
MGEIIEMGRVSSRGQICIPNSIRESMHLEEGSKLLFMLQDNILMVKKMDASSFADLTKPLKEAVKRSGMKEGDVNGIIHRMRKA